jgi:1-deoxy-D-xylulose-5-phosphate synthase
MLRPTGLDAMAAKFPERVVDVGIAEQHATASAAGLAFGGLHPVVAVYATFMGRAFDQVLMDVALHKAGVTFVLDRAGVTGPDGASHHGQWDLAMLNIVPGIRIAAPRDADTLRLALREALAINDAPTVIRFPKGNVPSPIPEVRRLADGVDVLREGKSADVLLVAVGSFAPLALKVADLLAGSGIHATVVDPRWVIPVPLSIIDLARTHRLVVSIEDGIRVGGVGTRIRQDLRAAGIDTGVDELGLPDEFLEHDSRDNILKRVGLDAESIAGKIAAQFDGKEIPRAKP